MRNLVVACSLLLVALRPALGDVEVALSSNSAVTATFAAGSEVHSYALTMPAGAKVTAVLRSAKGGPQLQAVLTSSAGVALADKSGKAPALKAVLVPTSGRHVLTVRSADGTSVGGYTAVVSWKSPKGPAKTLVVAPDGEGAVAFSADAGAVAKISLKKSKGSSATPVLASIQRPDGVSVALAPAASATMPLDGTGDFVVRFGAGPAGGSVKAVVALKPPKRPRVVTSLGALAQGAQPFAALRIGPRGGTLALGAGPLSGASLLIPPGALDAPTSIVLGSGFSVAGEQAGVSAGPAIFAGPEGIVFPDGKQVTVTIPFDPTAFGENVSLLRVYTRDAAGVVTLVPNPVIDFVKHLVSFPATHFSVFQTLREFTYTEPQEVQNPPVTTRTLLGQTLAVSGDTAAIAQFNAAGNVWEVKALRRSGGSFAPEADLLSPGGQTNDGFANTSSAVAAWGDRVLVGARGRFTTYGVSSGAGLVFFRDATGGWTFEAELAAATWQTNDFAGASVAIDGDTAAVGAPSAQNGTTAPSGAIHVFVRDQSSGLWSLQQTLTLPTGTGTFYFGTLRGDTAVGFLNANGVQSAHVFHRTAGAWTLDGSIPVPDPDGTGGNVTQVAVDGTTIVLGIVPSSVRGGEARVYEDQGTKFVEVARLASTDVTGPGEAPGTAYARSVAVSGDLLLVGCPSFRLRFPGSTTSLNGAGQTFVYQRIRGAWRLAARLRGTADDAFPIAANDGFGVRVALDGATAVVGASGTKTADGFVGAAFVFDFSGN